MTDRDALDDAKPAYRREREHDPIAPFSYRHGIRQPCEGAIGPCGGCSRLVEFIGGLWRHSERSTTGAEAVRARSEELRARRR